MRTLVTDDFQAHGWVAVPINDMDSDKASIDWMLQIRMSESVGIAVALEHLV